MIIKRFSRECLFTGVRHAKIGDLTQINQLLQEIRNIKMLREKQPTHFYYKGKNVIHFHIDNNEIFADIGNMRFKINIPVDTDQVDRIKTKINEYMDEIYPARNGP